MKYTKLWHKLSVTIAAIIITSQITSCGNKENTAPITSNSEIQTAAIQTAATQETQTEKETQTVQEIKQSEEILTTSLGEEKSSANITPEETSNIPIDSAPVTAETKETTAKQPVEIPVTKGTQEYAGEIKVNTNLASGTEVYTGNNVTIDASNKASGYLMVKYEGGQDKRVKVRITCNQVNYDYDLNLAGNYEAFPLQMGNGTYTVMVLQNAYDNQYAVLTQKEVAVQLSGETIPYLYPSQKVYFTANSAAVKKSYDLCAGLTTDQEKVTAVYNFMKSTITYDNEKAGQVTSGALKTYTSDADNILSIKKGICLDYATLMAVMLRAQNIPTQVIYGSENSAPYHAWNQIYLDGKWVLYDATYAAGGATGTNYTELKKY